MAAETDPRRMTFTEWLKAGGTNDKPLSPTSQAARAWLLGKDPKEYARKLEEK